jgi:hypothetical protein
LPDFAMVWTKLVYWSEPGMPTSTAPCWNAASRSVGPL